MLGNAQIFNVIHIDQWQCVLLTCAGVLIENENGIGEGKCKILLKFCVISKMNGIFITLRIDCLSVNYLETLTFVCERENLTLNCH